MMFNDMEQDALAQRQVQLFDGGVEDGNEPMLQGSLHEDDGVAWIDVTRLESFCCRFVGQKFIQPK